MIKYGFGYIDRFTQRKSATEKHSIHKTVLLHFEVRTATLSVAQGELIPILLSGGQ